MKLTVLVQKENREVQHQIISKIQELINYKNLEPGDRLPPERMMSEKFGVSRRNLTKAIQKLEFYGLLKSKPQSGTFVANIGRVAMNRMIEEILELGEPDFKSLIEARIELELTIVQFAANKRTEENLNKIKNALDAFKEKVLQGEDSLQEDLLFHLEIAKASNNSAMTTLMLLITSEIIGSYDRDRICKGDEALSEIKNHEDIYLAIKEKDPLLAKEKMEFHFTRLREFLHSLK